MSTKKKDLEFKIGDVARIDYATELNRKSSLDKHQKERNKRIALITNVIEKEDIGDFNKIDKLYRYKILVGSEIIEIDQACLRDN